MSKYIDEVPSLEGILWPLYLQSSSSGSSSALRAMLAQMRRWLLSLLRQEYNTSLRTWYVLQSLAPSHYLTLQAVMAELSSRGRYGLVIGPYPYESISLASGWDQSRYDIGKPEVPPGVSWGLLRKAKELAPGISAELLKESFWSPSNKATEDRLAILIFSALRLDWTMAKRLERHCPDVLVLGSDLGPVRNPITRHAQEMGAYTLVLQHGLQGEYAGTITSDEVSLWGEYHRRQTIKLGAPESKLVVDGSPRMDIALKTVRDPKIRLRTRESLGIRDDESLVVHLLDKMRLMRRLYPELTGSFVEAASAVFSRISENARVIIRPHPGDSLDDLVDFVNIPGVQIIWTDEMSLNEMFAAADIASTVLSAAGLEAIWCGLPVIYYQPTEFPSPVEFPRLGGGIAVRDANEWINVALKLATNPMSRQQQVEASADFCADTLAYPGESASRVANRIERHL